jgi:hypothetical protein
MPKTDNPTPNRYENVLLCAPEGDKPVVAIPTIKWMETILIPVKDAQGQEIYTPAGFLVTIPPHNSLKIYSHICRDVQNHAKAMALMVKDKNDHTPAKLPVVWNGAYNGCPLCALLARPEAK